MSSRWPECRIGDVGVIVTGTTPGSKSEGNWGDGAAFLTPSDMTDFGYVTRTGRRLSRQRTLDLSSRLLPPGAVSVSCIASIGKIARITEPTVSNQQINSLVPDEATIYPLFAFYWLRTVVPKLHQISSGSVAKIVNKTDFSNLKLVLPDMVAQRQIAGLLGALDDLIETNERLIRDLRKLVGAVLASRQSADVTIDVSLGDVFTFKEGQTSKPASRVTTGGVPIMGANGVIGSSSTANSSQSTVVLGKIGSAGALSVTYGPSWITNNAFEVLPREPWSRELVLALLRQVDFTSCIGGSANPYMPLKNFEHVRITLPSSIKQIASLARASESAIDQLGSEAKELKSTRDELLPLLMSGRIRVKDVAA